MTNLFAEQQWRHRHREQTYGHRLGGEGEAGMNGESNVEAYIIMGFPGGSDGKASACNVGDQGLIPGSGRSPGEGHGSPLQYSCLGNPMDRGTWWATQSRGVTKSRT